jgi:hypothetical protein
MEMSSCTVTVVVVIMQNDFNLLHKFRKIKNILNLITKTLLEYKLFQNHTLLEYLFKYGTADAIGSTSSVCDTT